MLFTPTTQIKESKETIAKSQALIERIDHLLANLAPKQQRFRIAPRHHGRAQVAGPRD
jgi:hypothetical protein